MREETAQDAVDAYFDSEGAPATYDGAAETVLIVVHRKRIDREMSGYQIGDMPIAERPISILVRESELADPAPGGVFVQGAKTYVIGEDEPVKNDSLGLVWRCVVTEQVS